MANVDSLTNKTWFNKSGFTGHSYVFYQLKGGDMKAIKQIHGSGVCAIASEIYDIEIKGDSLILFNGLNLNSGEISTTNNLFFDNETSELKENNEPLILFSPKPLIYNWATSEICDQVDFNRLLNIDIKKNEVYDFDKIQELRIERKK
jgi:hypothetical protein